MLTTRTKINYCTNCMKLLNEATSINSNKMPHEGGVTVCVRCGHISVFDKDLNLRPITTSELNEIYENDIETYTLLITVSAQIKEKIQKN
jgi:RNase P subunit RPR2